MLKGFNSDIQVRGQKYHIQTEDWGIHNPYIVSRVFSNGAVLKTIKTPYAEVFATGSTIAAEAVRAALQRQHHRIIDGLMTAGVLSL